MIYSFSGTGNSKYVAVQLASMLGEELCTIPNCETTQAESIGLVFPVYAWGIPSIVSDFIEKLKSEDVKYVWAVMTCGDDMGYADQILRKELKTKAGLALDAVFSVQMPNTYVCLPGFDVDADDVAVSKVQSTLDKLPKIVKQIQERRTVTDVIRGAMPYTKTYCLRPLFNSTLVTDKFFKTNDSCQKCGKCAKECPLNNISMTGAEGQPVWNGNCTGCLRCYHGCPQKAVQFGQMTKNKGQKQNLQNLIKNIAVFVMMFFLPLHLSAADPVNYTSYIQNPSFHDNVNGWTVDMPGAQNRGYQSASYNYNGVSISGFIETWVSSSSRKLGKGSITQSIGNIPDGRYQLQADIIACDQSQDNATDYTVSGVYLFAGSDVEYKKSVTTKSGQPIHYTLDFIKKGDKLTIGMKTDADCTSNWVAFDHVTLYYYGQEASDASRISVSPTSLTMCMSESYFLTEKVTAASEVYKKVVWSSSDESVASVDMYGKVTANNVGTATITAKPINSNLSATVKVNVEPSRITHLFINEIQVANIDMFIDPSFNYGGWVELYNPTSTNIFIGDLYISDDISNLKKFQLPYDIGIVPANGYKNIWFDHYDTGSEFSDQAYKQVDFKLNYEGGTIYISDANGNIYLQQTYPPAVPRTSYARTTDGGSTWMMTGEPTPAASNASSSFALTRLAAPVVDKDACVFTAPFTARVTIPAGATLRYTTDGSTPTLSNGSTSTTGEFNIGTSNAVYRFRLFRDGYLPSAVVTRSYIYQRNKYYLPIVSINTADANLYDEMIGAYVDGNNGTSGNNKSFSNKNRGWERPVNFEYLVPDEKGEYTVALNQELDFEVCGGWSRHFSPDASFRLKAGKYYEGINEIGYPVFKDKPYIKNKTLQVRNGGNDNYARIFDAALHTIILNSGMYVDCQACQPAHIFINGKHKFMFNVREPNNKNHGYSNYGIDTDLMDQFEINGKKGYEQKTGTDVVFRKWMSLAQQLGKNPNDESLYNQICEVVDIDEYTNYMAVECFIGSSDWLNNSNNVKGYRSQLDGKYHLVIMDLDAGFSTRGIITKFESNLNDSRYDTGKNFLIDIFLNMIKCPTFRKKFIDAFCIVDGSVFDNKVVENIITKMRDVRMLALGWESTAPTNVANNLISTINSQENRTVRMDYLADYLGLTSRYSVTINKNIPGGRLLINTEEIPTGKFVGTLFAPVELKATVPAGYSFVGWSNDGGSTIISTEESLPISLLGNPGTYNVLAVYEKLSDKVLLSDIATPLKINEVSASNSIYVNETIKKNDWFEIYNTTDTPLDVAGLYVSDDITQPMKYQIPSYAVDINTIIPANGHLIVWADKLAPTSQLHTNFKLSNADNQMVLLTSSDEFIANNSAFFSAHPALKDFADGLKYNMHDGDQSVGRYPDGANNFYRMARPTIEKSNSKHSYDDFLGIDEGIMSKDSNIKIDLAQGWNWISHPLSEALSVNEFKSSADRILSHNLEAYYSSEAKVMKGMLKSLTAGNMYKVEADKAASYSFSGETTTNRTFNLKAGWNWVGYPTTGTQSITTALAGSHVEEGDVIVGQNGFSTYTESDGWVGTLSSLVSGNGYMYHSASTKAIRFNESVANVKLRRQAMALNSLEKKFGFNRHDYPDVMCIIATLQIDGTPMLEDHFTVAAYSQGECRGAGEFVNGRLFLTLHGEGSEPLTFKAFDSNNDSYNITNTLSFTPDMMGTMSSPYILNIGEPEVTDIAAYSTSSAAVPVAYYNLSGSLVSSHKSQLRPGIYIVRMSDGRNSKIMIK